MSPRIRVIHLSRGLWRAYTGEGMRTTGIILLARKVTDRTVLRVLAAGLLLILLVSLVTGLAGVRGLLAIQDNSQELVSELRLTATLIAQIQRQIANLSAITHRLSRSHEAVDTETIQKLVDDARESISRIVRTGTDTPEEERWRELEAASTAFSQEVRRSLETEGSPVAATRTLFQHHAELIRITSGLINLSYRRAVQAQAEIDRQSERLIRQTLYVVGACLLLAGLFALLTLRLARRLIGQMDIQARELSRVSWHLLENQETTAKRFSHELHDELGQSLTAVKANLAALAETAGPGTARMQDCVALVDESIQNVRAMSQLLHPRILDDFGLDAALKSLAERFQSRTGIAVHYSSNFERRLPPQMATHLFRIGQEALTNVAKHSRATEVRIRLWRDGDTVTLTVDDNGVGLLDNSNFDGLGLIAMSARARNLGGECNARRGVSGGTSITVRIPVPASEEDEEKDPHLVSG